MVAIATTMTTPKMSMTWKVVSRLLAKERKHQSCVTVFQLVAANEPWNKLSLVVRVNGRQWDGLAHPGAFLLAIQSLLHEHLHEYWRATRVSDRAMIRCGVPQLIDLEHCPRPHPTIAMYPERAEELA